MKKEILAEGVVHYIFDAKPDRRFATSVTAIFNGNKVTLIDTAYESQVAELLEEFSKNKVEVEQVIITHFHEDHIEGLKLLTGVPIYGIDCFGETLNKFIEKEEHHYFTPSIIVTEPLSLAYGEHNLTLIPFPGHSKCGMLIKINDRFVHIGDELLFGTNGMPLLPLSDGFDLQRHLDSLERLEGYAEYTLIPSHGPIFSGEKLVAEIKNRYRYLKALHDHDRSISYEDATKECDCTFLHNEWHEWIRK